MGGFCTPTYTPLPSSGETVEGTEIPSWVAAAGRTLFERSAELANSDYPLYTGARTQTYTGGSNLTDAERQGMGILTSGAENYMPYMNRASDIAGTLGRGYDAMSSSELMGDPYSGASRGYLEGNFKGLSSDELLGNYQGATREELLGNYQGATREELLGDPFNLSSAQPYMDIYQSSMDPAVREIEKQTLQAQNQARATAARGGGGFGSRLGIMEATTAGEGSRAAGDLRAQAAKEGLGFAAGRYDTDRAARAATENTMRNRFTQDQQSRFGARRCHALVNSWKIAKAVCLWKTHAGRRQNQIALLALAQRMSCMAATATSEPLDLALKKLCVLVLRLMKPLALHK
jgi:hypothetical protein